VAIPHGPGQFVLGAIDDLIFGRPDWPGVLSPHGAPHLLIAHNPDHFYEAEAHGVPLTLSGHTHGGQIRFPGGPPIIRHSRFCLDEGVFAFRSSLLVVTRAATESSPYSIEVKPADAKIPRGSDQQVTAHLVGFTFKEAAVMARYAWVRRVGIPGRNRPPPPGSREALPRVPPALRWRAPAGYQSGRIW